MNYKFKDMDICLEKLEVLEDLETLTSREFIKILSKIVEDGSLSSKIISDFSVQRTFLEFEYPPFGILKKRLSKDIFFIMKIIDSSVEKSSDALFILTMKEIKEIMFFFKKWITKSNYFGISTNPFDLFETYNALFISFFQKVDIDESLRFYLIDFLDGCVEALDIIVQKNKESIVEYLKEENGAKLKILLKNKLRYENFQTNKYADIILFLSENHTVSDIVKKRKELEGYSESVSNSQSINFTIEASEDTSNIDKIFSDVAKNISTLGDSFKGLKITLNIEKI